MSSVSVMDKILYTSVVIYILVMTLIIIFKPTFMYDEHTHEPKPFGTNTGETMFPIHVVGVFSCILIYTIVAAYHALLKLIDK